MGAGCDLTKVEEPFIDTSLIKKDQDKNIKYNLDIIWIDEKVFNWENNSYFEEMRNQHPNIKINLFNNLEDGFNQILSLKFISVFVIISGRLYSQYYNKLKSNLNEIKCIPINLFFILSKFKNILEKKEEDTEQIISYDIQR